VAVTVPQFLLAPHLVTDSDLTLVLPRRVAEVGARPLGLAVRDLPEGISSFNASMVWHRRLDNDPALVWLRDLVRRAVCTPAEPAAKAVRDDSLDST
jgi:DNA-binding transcriptional LysR family regulator